jgi:hypothetical protein
MGGSLSTIADHNMDESKDAQPSIDAEEDNMESPWVDDEDELSTDQIRASKKVNSITTIEALRLKPSSLSCMQVPLSRMVPMSIVRPILSSNREGAAVFYLSITNEGGQIEKVTDEDLTSWGPY